jgi:hypothetical protein
MFLPVWAAFALLVLLDLVPIALFYVPIVRAARKAGVRVGWYCYVAVFGGLLAAMIVQVVTVQFLVSDVPLPWPVPFVAEVVLVYGIGVLASTVVAGGVWWHLRAKTARDPDYGEPAGSLKAHVPQPRDGDDVLPK